jgi:hypothetical protein
MENTNIYGDERINSTLIRIGLARIKTIKIIPHRNCMVTCGGNKILRGPTLMLFSKSIKKYYGGWRKMKICHIGILLLCVEPR